MHADLPGAARSGPRLSVREEGRLRTRARILDAAREVFAANGFTSTSVADITKVAGVNRATFYMHFTSKSDVMLGTAAPVMDAASAYWSDLGDVLLNASRSTVRGWISRASRWWDEHSDILPVIREATIVDAAVAAAMAQRFHGFSSSIEAFLDRESTDRSDQLVRVQILVTMVDQVIAGRALLGPATDREQVIDVLTDIWVRTLQLD